MAEFLMKDLVKSNGKENNFYICSSATSLEEIGNPIHRGTREILNKHKVKFDDHRAIQLTKTDYDKYDYIIGMDNFNVKNILRIIGTDTSNKVFKLLDFVGGGDVKDLGTLVTLMKPTPIFHEESLHFIMKLQKRPEGVFYCKKFLSSFKRLFIF